MCIPWLKLRVVSTAVNILLEAVTVCIKIPVLQLFRPVRVNYSYYKNSKREFVKSNESVN